MTYPKFYKNGKRFTCVKSETEFIQVTTMLTVGAIHYGTNEHFAADAERCDTEITAKEFEDAAMVHIYALTQLTAEVEQMIAEKI